MKIPLVALALPLLLALVACSIVRDDVREERPDLLQAFDAAQQAAEQAERDLGAAQALAEEATLTPGDEDDQEAAGLQEEAGRRLSDAEAQLAQVESKVIEGRAQPLNGLLPYGLGAVAVELLKVAGSRRVRRHYGSAVRSISRGQILVAAGDLLKGLGARHSSPESEAASEKS
jgi:hypothetical protein